MVTSVFVSVFEVLVYPGLLFILVVSLLYSGILRKLAARMQNRVGPPIVQPVYDVVKWFSKESIVPDEARAGFNMWPVVSVVAVVVAGLMIPMGGAAVLDGSGGIILLIYFLALSSAAVYMAGFSSSNPFGVMGGIRGITQMIAYEVPFIVSVLVVIIAIMGFGGVDYLSVSAINSFQVQNVWLIQLYPLAGFVFLLTLVGKIEMPPFHTPGAHQELVGGYSAEYSGAGLGMIEAAHIIKGFVVMGLAVALFLGGAGTIWVFAAKTLGFLVVLTVLRVVMARLRIEHILEFYWLLAIVAGVDLIRVILVPAGL